VRQHCLLAQPDDESVGRLPLNAAIRNTEPDRRAERARPVQQLEGQTPRVDQCILFAHENYTIVALLDAQRPAGA